MRQHPLRITLSAIAAAMLALSLASCAALDDASVPSSPESSTNDAEAPAQDSSQAGNLDCNWGEARLLVADYSAPGEQQGDLAETLVGNWQFTHYDLGFGDGWEPWEEAEDRRYVYSPAGELVHCVTSSAGGSPSALGAIYSVDGDQITLDNGNGWTAVAWTKDVLLLSNHFDDSLELHHRR